MKARCRVRRPDVVSDGPRATRDGSLSSRRRSTGLCCCSCGVRGNSRYARARVDGAGDRDGALVRLVAAVVGEAGRRLLAVEGDDAADDETHDAPLEPTGDELDDVATTSPAFGPSATR